MKTLTKLALAAIFVCYAFVANAQWKSGYYRSTTTHVQPSFRTYTPSYSSSYTSYSYTPSYFRSTYSGYNSGCRAYSSSYSIYGSSIQTGGTTFHNYHSSEGASLSGTTTKIGTTSFTTLRGW